MLAPVKEALDMNALQRLIRQRMDEHGLSYGDIAKAGGLPKSTVYKLASQTDWSHSPRATTLDALARGLGVPAATVRNAVSEATGLTAHVTEAETDLGLKVLIGSIEALSDDQRKQVAALVDAMVRQSI